MTDLTIITTMFVLSMLFSFAHALLVWHRAYGLIDSANRQASDAWGERQDLRDRLAAEIWENRRLRREAQEARGGEYAAPRGTLKRDYTEMRDRVRKRMAARIGRLL